MNVALRGCTFADIELRKVRRSHVESWIKGMHSRGLAASTIRTRANNVRAVLRAAVRDKLIGADPSEGVTLPRARKVEQSMRIPTPEELRSLLSTSEPWFAPFVALCAFGGLRLGEAAALQIGDVDFLRRQIHVRRQVQRQPGGLVRISPPKYGSERTIVAPDALLELLSLHVRDLGVYGEAGWLFVGEHGNPPHQNTIHYWWKKTAAAAAVEGVRLHDLRHFYASGLIAAGCDVVTVQRALGHARPTTTLNTYGHLWPDAEDRTRAAAAGLMEAVFADSADRLRTVAP
ncbi:site-specific integrase [Microbacterium sp. BLY]|nr:site-specific integrase [Microbacterium sp. BLY]